jgi:hypothetical protein
MRLSVPRDSLPKRTRTVSLSKRKRIAQSKLLAFATLPCTGFLPPSPPAEKATACEDQTGGPAPAMDPETTQLLPLPKFTVMVDVMKTIRSRFLSFANEG